MKRDTIDCLNKKIPPTQAACRSTTKHEFVAKVITMKAVTSKYHPVYLLLLDMSNFVDRYCQQNTVDRQAVLKDLEHTIILMNYIS